MIRVGISGAAGRMGRRLTALTQQDPDLRLAAAIEAPDNPAQGQDAGTVAGVGPADVIITSQLPADLDVLIDFTVPAATRKALKACQTARIATVIGTTGLTDEDHKLIDAAAQTIAVLQAPNMSLGVNLLLAIAGQMAAQLGVDYDVEIAEAHHRFKKDAPSGTALAIAQSICDATGRSVDRDVVHGRHGDDLPRQPGQIGMHALRVGDVVGRHTVTFATLGEELRLTHVASSRDVFAHGALRAAKWLAAKPAGRYHIADILGL